MSKNYVIADFLGTLNTATMIVPGQPYQMSGFFSGPAFKVRIINRSNINVFIAYGTLAEANAGELITRDICPTLGEINLDFQTNSRPNNKVALMQQGFAVWGISPIAGVGNIYATCYYQTE